ncbi:MAG TPA: winged helix-turn-helix domain-containing protein [Blastocatellia bacterium]
MSQQTGLVYEFDSFRVDSVKRLLLRAGEPLPITSKVFDLLLILIANGGQVVQKEELIRRLWPDTAVEENNLTQHVAMLRRALGERAAEHRYVVTVPGRGYSFVADVRVLESAHEAMPEQSRSQIEMEKKNPARSRMNAFILMACAFTVVMIALVVYWRLASRANQTTAHIKSIAILPFKSLTETNDDYLGAGMADTLIARLSQLKQINVRSTSAVMRYAVGSQDALSFGREIGVDSVVEGTIQRSGERVRVTVQLMSVRDERAMWAQSFDEKFTDIFALQDSISERVAESLLVKLTGDEHRQIKKHGTDNLEAYLAYMRGRYFWNKRNEAGLNKSIEYFDQAISLDPVYAQAYAGLSDAYNVLGSYKFGPLSPDENFRRAKAAALRALELDDTLAEAHTSLASTLHRSEGNREGAEKEYRRAIELNPNYATVHHWYSDFLALTGRNEEALVEIQLARELDPLSPVISTTLAERFYFARQYDRAIEQLMKTLELDANFLQAHFILGLAYEQKGLYAEAIRELREAQRLGGDKPYITSSLAHACAISGRRAEARSMLNHLITMKSAAPFDIGLVYAGLAEKDEALRWFQKDYDRSKARTDSLTVFSLDPRLDLLRADPRFQSLMHSL